MYKQSSKLDTYIRFANLTLKKTLGSKVKHNKN